MIVEALPLCRTCVDDDSVYKDDDVSFNEFDAFASQERHHFLTTSILSCNFRLKCTFELL